MKCIFVKQHLLASLKLISWEDIDNFFLIRFTVSLIEVLVMTIRLINKLKWFCSFAYEENIPLEFWSYFLKFYSGCFIFSAEIYEVLVKKNWNMVSCIFTGINSQICFSSFSDDKILGYFLILSFTNEGKLKLIIKFIDLVTFG